MTAALRAGLVGLGAMGRNHARVLNQLEGVELVAVADAIVTDTRPSNLDFDGLVTVAGAAGFTPGEAGTVRFLYLPPPTGSLFMVR